MARGMSLSVRRGLLLVSALIFAVARAQVQVPGCTGCTVTCGALANAMAPLTLRVACATPLGSCAMCISASSSVAFGLATNSSGDSAGGCLSQVGLAASILGECTAGSISLPTATTGGTGNAVIIGPTLTSPTGSIF